MAKTLLTDLIEKKQAIVEADELCKAKIERYEEEIRIRKPILQEVEIAIAALRKQREVGELGE